MKQLSIIPEFLIWLVFSVLAGFGYAFSVFDYIGKNAELSAIDIVIPTLVWLLVAAVSAFFINLAKKTQCFAKFSKFERVFLEGGILLLLLVGGWLFRFAQPFHDIWPVNIENEFFHYAQVSTQSEVYTNSHPASRLYVGFLHIVFLFLGNIYEAGALTQYVLLLVGVFLWYLAVRKLLGQVTALCFMAGAMLLPDSIIASMQYNPMMLLFTIYGVLILFIAGYMKSHRMDAVAYVGEFFVGIGIGAVILLDISGLMFVPICVAVIWYRYKDRGIGNRILHIITCLIGCVISCAALYYVHIHFYNVDFYTKHTLQIPEFTQLKAFVFELGTHPVFMVSIVTIVTFWFVKSRGICTWIMTAILYLLGLKILHLDFYMQHDFLIYAGLLMLLGMTLREAVAVKKVEATNLKSQPVTLQEMPVVTVVHFEEESAVTVPEKQEEKPVIFIPKSMEIPKRISKPKVEFAIEVAEENMHYDVTIDDNADFDIK
jgi:hypothetical protein